MYKYININKKILLAFLMFFPVVFVYATDITQTSSVTISATVNQNSSTSSGGGTGFVVPTLITFSGIAYPSSKVYLLKDGIIISTINLDNNTSNFSISINNLNTNVYTFSIYAEDSWGNKSSFYSFPIFINRGVNININNILLSPTINIDKNFVKKGDSLKIFGQSLPNKEVLISLNLGSNYIYHTFSNSLGYYFYNLDTSNFNFGKYFTKSKTIIDSRESLYTSPIVFNVGDFNFIKDNIVCSSLIGDLNCDNHVNLTDFSIMSFWYKKVNPPNIVDLNNDKLITMVDFSIMAFNWTE